MISWFLSWMVGIQILNNRYLPNTTWFCIIKSIPTFPFFIIWHQISYPIILPVAIWMRIHFFRELDKIFRKESFETTYPHIENKYSVGILEVLFYFWFFAFSIIVFFNAFCSKHLADNLINNRTLFYEICLNFPRVIFLWSIWFFLLNCLQGPWWSLYNSVAQHWYLIISPMYR